MVSASRYWMALLDVIRDYYNYIMTQVKILFRAVLMDKAVSTKPELESIAWSMTTRDLVINKT